MTGWTKIKGAARYAGISERSFRKWLKDGLRHVRMNTGTIASKAKEVDPDGFTAKTEALDPVTLVRVEAHRYGAGGETLLYFHGEYSRFDVLEGNRR